MQLFDCAIFFLNLIIILTHVFLPTIIFFEKNYVFILKTMKCL